MVELGDQLLNFFKKKTIVSPMKNDIYNAPLLSDIDETLTLGPI